MDRVTQFLRMAPQLGGVVTLVGMAILSFFGLLKYLVEKGIIPAPPRKEAARLIHKLLNYAFWFAILVTVLGFACLILPKIVPAPTPKTPELSLSFADHDEYTSRFANEAKGNSPRATVDLTAPIQEHMIELSPTYSFEDVTTPDPQKPERELWYGGHGWEFFPYVINLGEVAAEGIWFKFYVPNEVEMLSLLPTWMDMSTDENSNRSRLELAAGPPIDIAPKKAFNAEATLAFHFLPIPQTYTFPYEVGANNAKTTKGELKIQIKTSRVEPAFVENARGLRADLEQNPVDGLQHFQNAIKLNPAIAGFHFNAAIELWALEGEPRHLERALEQAELVVRMEPDRPRPQDIYCMLLAELGRLDDAEKGIDYMLSRNWTPYNGRFKLVQQCLNEGDSAKGIRLLENILRAFPEDYTAMCDVAAFYIKTGRLADAEERLSRAYKGNPEDEATLQNLKRLADVKAKQPMR